MDFKLPELGEGVYEAEMTRWLVKPGEHVAPGKALLEVLTDKATMEVPSPFAGVISSLGVEPGQVLKIGQPVLSYDPADGNNDQPVAARAENGKRLASNDSVVSNPGASVKAAPAVRQQARERGIDLASVNGSGPGGRILITDLPAPAPPSAPAEPANDFGRAGTRIKLQGLRRKIAEHMVQATRTVPHFTYIDECDVTDLVRTRTGLREVFSRKGVKLTYLAFIVKAVVHALQEVPIVNATLDEKAEEIVLLNQYHIGIAVGAPAGLIVPVIHDADKKSLLEIARDIERLSEEARTGKSRLEDLRGGTFTITSIGSMGGLFACPIIHQPQVGILGVGKIVQRPVFDKNGNVIPADMIYLSFVFDHRVLDGSSAVAFGNAVIKRLLKPMELAME